MYKGQGMKRLLFIIMLLALTDNASAWSGSPDGGFGPKIKAWPYSIAGACDAIHDQASATVTLEPGELMQNAMERLRQLSPDGGVIEIPEGTTTQCDSLTLKEDHYFKDGLTLRGVGSPRFYCRSDFAKYKLGGTVPHEEVESHFLSASGAHHNVLIEGIEVDGYKSAIKYGDRGEYIIRNSWLHHGPGSGVSSGNTGGSGKNPYRGIEDPSRFSLEVCGSEVSHYGQGNHTHNFYMHRALGGGPGGDGFDTWSAVLLVDNVIHSPGWASAYKSIANENVIINNTFFSHLYGGSRFHAQMLVDIPSCSRNMIKGNRFFSSKPSKNAGGSAILGLRGRRTAMRGCEVPLAWHPYTNKNSPVPLAKDPNDPVHTEQWWTEQNGRIWFPAIIEDNVFTVSGTYRHRQTAIEISGTYWVYEGPKKVSCFLPTPNNWYERSRLYSSGNTFTGFKKGKIYKTILRKHNKNCVNQPQPPGPGPSNDLYEVVN